MKLRDFATQIYVDPAKLTTYALNSKHPKGQHKARVFRAILGFTSENQELLVSQISDRALNEDAVLIHIDQYGHHLQVDLTILGINGQEAIVRTGWQVKSIGNTAFLTTLFVHRR